MVAAALVKGLARGLMVEAPGCHRLCVGMQNRGGLLLGVMGEDQLGLVRRPARNKVVRAVAQGGSVRRQARCWVVAVARQGAGLGGNSISYGAGGSVGGLTGRTVGLSSTGLPAPGGMDQRDASG